MHVDYREIFSGIKFSQALSFQSRQSYSIKVNINTLSQTSYADFNVASPRPIASSNAEDLQQHRQPKGYLIQRASARVSRFLLRLQRLCIAQLH